MLLAMAALLFQFPLFSANTLSANKAALDASASVAVASAADVSAVDAAPVAEAAEAAPIDARVEGATAFMPARLVPEPVPFVANAAPAASVTAPATPFRPAITPVHSKIASERRDRRIWLGLSIAEHGAATFDAWSTRRVISSGLGREENPLLRPFAGNASMYAAVQVGPVIFDLLSRKMMTSSHAWMRHTWWVPQILSTAVSVSSGIHNLGVYSTINGMR